MTAMTAATLFVMTGITVLALIGALHARRCRSNHRRASNYGIAACLSLALSQVLPGGWHVMHYFDIRDGTTDSPLAPRPFIIAGVLLFVVAAVLGFLTAVQAIVDSGKRRSPVNLEDQAER
jgi:hypothetical protein